MPKYTKTTVTQLSANEQAALDQINKNFEDIQSAIADTVSRSGAIPSHMTNDLDMNGKRIINVPTPKTENDLVRQKDVVGDIATVQQLVNTTTNAAAQTLEAAQAVQKIMEDSHITLVADDLALGEDSNIVQVANNKTNIDTVAGSISNVNTVGTDIANVNTVASNTTNINTVAGISSDVTTVAGLDEDIPVVVSLKDDIPVVVQAAEDIDKVEDIAADITTVAGISSSVSTVAGMSSNIASVVSNATNINSVAGDLTNINAVAADLTNIDAASSYAAESKQWAIGYPTEPSDGSAKYWAAQASAGQLQADWNQSDNTKKDYIKNKPNYGASLSYSSNTLQLKDQNGNNLGSSVTIQSSPDIDELSITKNGDDELQTIGVIDQRDTSTAIKTWTGTLAQYQAIVSKDANTVYNITDDTTSLTNVYTKAEVDALLSNKIQQVASLPASPVAGVLYLIPE